VFDISINMVVCEDKQIILRNFGTSLEKIIQHNNLDANISFTTDEPKRVLEYAKQCVQGINAYFLDIHLGGKMNGLELARQIRCFDPNGYIVFVTGHPELCATTFKYHVEAFEYLNKPVSYQALEDCVLCINKHYTDYMNYQTHNKNAAIKIRSGNRDYNIELENIIYVESINQKLVVHTKNRNIEFFGYLKDTIHELNKNGENFYRCHRSYIININQVKEANYKGSYVIMQNDEKCFISRQQKGEIKEVLDRMVQEHDDYL